MATHPWREEISEAAALAWSGLRYFWRQDIWPVLMTVWFFLMLAVPLLLVILVLWYLDSIGWRPERGYYTIGSVAAFAFPRAARRGVPAWLWSGDTAPRPPTAG